jgi:hypothetical protein
MSAKRATGPGEFDGRKVDRAVARAGAAISKAIDKMVVELPEEAAPQMAILRLVGELTRRRPLFMQQVMSDHEAREAYEAAIAEMPATPGRTDRPTVRASAAQRRRMTARRFTLAGLSFR